MLVIGLGEVIGLVLSWYILGIWGVIAFGVVVWIMWNS